MKFVIYSFFIFTLVSCGERSELIFRDNTVLNLKQESLVGFSEVQDKILIPHCIQCHKKATSEEGIAKWIVPGSPSESSFFLSVKEGRMPKKAASLSSADLEIIESYIKNLVQRVNFTDLKERILVPHCISCHKSKTTEDSLSKWIDFEEPLNSRLYQSVREGKMPKDNPLLSREEEELIQRYLLKF